VLSAPRWYRSDVAETIPFYFDYLSPYAYLGWHRMRALAKEEGWTLDAKPLLFGALLNHWGQLGPAEIPPKKKYTFKNAYRLAHAQGLPPLVPPATHPFNPLAALRLSLREVAGERQHEVIDVLFAATWARGREASDVESLVADLEEAGLPGKAMAARLGEPAVKAALRANVEEAIAAGVFGVPSMVVRGEVFWGQDDVPHLLAFLAGEDPAEGVEVWREPSIERKR